MSATDLTKGPIYPPGASNVSEGINLTLNVADCGQAKSSDDYLNEELYCVYESNE